MSTLIKLATLFEVPRYERMEYRAVCQRTMGIRTVVVMKKEDEAADELRAMVRADYLGQNV